LEAAVKAVIMAWQEFSAQTDALLAVLGLPDNDDYLGPDSYLSQLRSAFELKAGRQFSAANMDKLHGAMDGITEHVKNVKSMLNAADSPLKDENNQGDDYGDLIASGQHNTPGKKGSGQEPEHTATTPSTTQQEPELDATTLAEIQSTLLRGKLVSAAWQASAKE
jgi:hypothetical protein